ncbi:MAG: hypothetical protein LC776_08180, partial [Acidobacteria bacterium]|nr:hypothetical protein [Acidobacteriota bacterium]
TMPTEYEARILKLDLPEQDALKNDPERCSADPAMLESIGRAVKHQVRIKRADDPRFVALYTVSVANPQGDLSNPSRANVVRTGQAGRERLGTSDEMKAVVQATVVDTAPPPNGVRFFEVAIDDRTQAYFIAIAPHGGAIEPHTDDEAKRLRLELVSNSYPATMWTCEGYGDTLKGAFDRWHITSTDLHPASFPLLQTIATRTFCHEQRTVPICDARFPTVARWLSRDLRKTHAWGMLAASRAPRDQQLSLRYCAMGVIWLATICQRPCIFTQTLMKRYGPLLSLPL